MEEPQETEQDIEKVAKVFGLEVEDVKKMFSYVSTKPNSSTNNSKISLLSMATGAVEGLMWGYGLSGLSDAAQNIPTSDNIPEWYPRFAGNLGLGVITGLHISRAPKRWKSWLLGFGLAGGLHPSIFKQMVSFFEEGFLKRPYAEQLAIVTNVSRAISPLVTVTTIGGISIGLLPAIYLREPPPEKLEYVLRQDVDGNNIAALLEAGQEEYRRFLIEHIAKAASIATGKEIDLSGDTAYEDFLATPEWEKVTNKIIEAGVKNDRAEMEKLFRPLLTAANRRLKSDLHLSSFPVMTEYLGHEYQPLIDCLKRYYPREFMSWEVNKYTQLEKRFETELRKRESLSSKMNVAQYISDQKEKYPPVMSMNDAEKVLLSLSELRDTIDRLDLVERIESLQDNRLLTAFSDLLQTQRNMLAKQKFAAERLVRQYIAALPAAKKPRR